MQYKLMSIYINDIHLYYSSRIIVDHFRLRATLKKYQKIREARK